MIDEHELEERLRSGCPHPGAGWRGSLRRDLLAWPPPPGRPTRLWLRVGAAAGVGAALLGVAAVGF